MPTKPTKAGFLAALLCSIAVVSWSQYSITVEASEATSPELTRYRVYVNMMDPADRLSAIYGTDTDPLSLVVPNGAFNSPFNSSWNASGVNPAFLTSFPSLADDSYATVGLTGPASTSSLPNAEDPSLVEDSNQPITPFFLVNGILTGSGLPEPIVWYNDAENFGLRLGTIPVEDAIYNLGMLLTVVFVGELIQRTRKTKSH